MSIKNKITNEASHVAHVSSDAVTSRAYFYPPLGLIYFITHPSLWAPLRANILPCLLLSFGVIVPMFLFTYLPQAAILSLLNGPLGPINAAALVLSESAFIVTTVAKSFLLEHALLDVFDATLVSEGQEALVSKGRELKPGKSGLEGVKKLGKSISKPLQKFSPEHIIQYVIFLPLNLIPIVGTAAFLIIQGRKSGPGYHARYFQLKGFSNEERNAYIASHKGAYVAFGTASMVMNLVPLASIAFTFTSTVGAALWAAELEKGTKNPGTEVDVKGEQVKDQWASSSKKDL
ncbi:hypothetical protein SISNIDRAFT_406774 [Sistotremastrum niveocremeum HHB9708]|uniref:Outer spore wall protein RRT8 n=1 Tax=Sistotremastrum niveocremeum HHB9708 TaxID=1314777 RepID=A0A164YKA3_9AGAM|nr:hypothetical protein SISNIDRAFT_406774 [Sistotremastrum niveocremeum HHB9708]